MLFGWIHSSHCAEGESPKAHQHFEAAMLAADDGNYVHALGLLQESWYYQPGHDPVKREHFRWVWRHIRIGLKRSGKRNLLQECTPLVGHVIHAEALVEEDLNALIVRLLVASW